MQLQKSNLFVYNQPFHNIHQHQTLHKQLDLDNPYKCIPLVFFQSLFPCKRALLTDHKHKYIRQNHLKNGNIHIKHPPDRQHM